MTTNGEVSVTIHFAEVYARREGEERATMRAGIQAWREVDHKTPRTPVFCIEEVPGKFRWVTRDELYRLKRSKDTAGTVYAKRRGFFRAEMRPGVRGFMQLADGARVRVVCFGSHWVRERDIYLAQIISGTASSLPVLDQTAE